jgi:hypothetical protein
VLVALLGGRLGPVVETSPHPRESLGLSVRGLMDRGICLCEMACCGEIGWGTVFVSDKEESRGRSDGRDVSHGIVMRSYCCLQKRDGKTSAREDRGKGKRPSSLGKFPGRPLSGPRGGVGRSREAILF